MNQIRVTMEIRNFRMIQIFGSNGWDIGYPILVTLDNVVAREADNFFNME